MAIKRVGYLDVATACKRCGVGVFRLDGIDDQPHYVDAHVYGGSEVVLGYRLDATGPRLRARVLTHSAVQSPHEPVLRVHECAAAQPSKGPQRMHGQQEVDPFDRPDSRPSVSFKGAPVGATITMTVDSTAKQVQARDFETNQPDTWPDGNPKFNAVIDVTVNGADMSLWALIPSSKFSALKAAQTAAGVKFAPGGTLVVKFVGEKPNDNPRLNAQKLYEAHYTPPTPADPFAGEPTQPAPAPEWAPTPAAPAATPAAPAPASPPWEV